MSETKEIPIEEYKRLLDQAQELMDIKERKRKEELVESRFKIESQDGELSLLRNKESD